jgi:hypothetical protein
LILTEPRGLVPCHERSWGFTPQGFSLQRTSSGLVTRRYPRDVSPSAPKSFRTRPQGLASRGSPLPSVGYCTHRRPDALSSFQSASAALGIPAWSSDP